jgi:hypothetical protein
MAVTKRASIPLQELRGHGRSRRVGGALLLASVTARALWSMAGPSATFLAGAAFAAVAAIGSLAYGTTSQVGGVLQRGVARLTGTLSAPYMNRGR